MEKKQYISPAITVVRCEAESIMEFSKTGMTNNTGGSTEEVPTAGGSSSDPSELSKENSGGLWDFDY